jgi:hypothetical protein
VGFICQILAFLAKIEELSKKIYVFSINNGAQDFQKILNNSGRVTKCYRRPTLKNYILYIIIIPCLAFCASSVHAKTDIEVVMTGKLPYDKSMTIGDAFNNFRLFQNKTWKFRQEEDKKKLIIFTGTLDLGNLRRYNNKLGGLKAAFIRVIFVLNTDKSIDVRSFSYHIQLPREFNVLSSIINTPDSIKYSVLNIYRNDSKSGLIISHELVSAFPLLEDG